MRAGHDAVITGIGTVLADDPQLTAREVGGHDDQPLRVVFDTRLQLPEDCTLVASRRVASVLVFTGLHSLGTDHHDRLRALGVDVHGVATRNGRPDPREALGVLAQLGIRSAMLECGGRLAASFLEADLVDRIAWFRAPKLIGAEGQPALGPLGLSSLTDAPEFALETVRRVGNDLLETYLRRQ